MSRDKSWKPKVVMPEPWIPPEHLSEAVFPPKTIGKTARRGDVLYLAGVGDVSKAEIMFVQLAALEEQVEEATITSFGERIPGHPGYNRGPVYEMIEHSCAMAELPMDVVYYTALQKWLLPKELRDKPKKHCLAWGREAFENEVRRIKPKIIVCLGKKVFDQLQTYKFKLGEIAGGWFETTVAGHTCKLYPMEDPAKAIVSPDLLERQALDIKEVRMGWQLMTGRREHVEEPINTEVIRNSTQLRAWVNRMLVENYREFSTDCEWRGQNHAQGQLRYAQFAWSRTDCVVIRFCDPAPDEKSPMPYAFDVSYKEAGEILMPLFGLPETKLMGHQIAADLPWLHVWLGLPYRNKVVFDSLYAQQTADENQELKLERMGMLRTGLPRWDIKLQIWKKNHPLSDTEGYGRVPDDILIPYAACDVISVFRMREGLEAEIKAQGMKLWFYYKTKYLPFTTEGFAYFTIVGIPIHREKMEEMRNVYQWAYDWQAREFKKALIEDSWECLEKKLKAWGVPEDTIPGKVADIKSYLASEDQIHLAEDEIKSCAGPDRADEALALFGHLRDAPDFNIRSQDQLQRWVFGVKGFTPLRSTGNKEKGIPSMAWDKVLAFSEEQRRGIKPSCDKNALQVYATKDKTISKLLSLNLTGNLTKGFLRPADKDPESGEVVKENGLFFWLAEDQRIHGQWSSTDTARPRSWNPNVYNLQAYVNKRVAEGVMESAKQAAKLAEKLGDLSIIPNFMQEYVDVPPMSIRNLSRATGDWDTVESLGAKLEKLSKAIEKSDNPDELRAQRAFLLARLKDEIERVSGEAWCVVETDFQTAEVKCLAFESGDEKMIAAVTGVDTNFAVLKADREKTVRVSYTSLNPAPEDKRRPEFLMHHVSAPEKRKDLVGAKDKIPEGMTREQYAESKLDALRAAGKKVVFIDSDQFVVCTPVRDDELVKNEDGSYQHPRRDLHWEIVEEAYGLVRETMLPKIHRASGKVVNFSSAYGASPASLERKIEVDTGVKPPEGTGQLLLDALERKYPVAQAWLREIEKSPIKGNMQVFSGRIRHFRPHPEELQQLKSRQRESVISALGREARNYPMQHTVANIAAQSHMKMIDEFDRLGLRAVNIALLYDSVVSMCPVRERFKVRELHYRYMRDETYEIHHGRELHMGCDVEFNLRWSGRPAKDIRRFLDDPNWCNDYPESALAA